MLCAKNELSLIYSNSNCIERKKKFKGTFWFAECLPEKWSEIRQPTFILYIGVMSIYSSLTMWIETRSNINQRYCFNLLIFVAVWKFPRVFIGENRSSADAAAGSGNGQWMTSDVHFFGSLCFSFWTLNESSWSGNGKNPKDRKFQWSVRTADLS